MSDQGIFNGGGEPPLASPKWFQTQAWANKHLKEEYTGFNHTCDKPLTLDDGSEIRPDHVVHMGVPGEVGFECECVADTKERHTLEPRDVNEVERYCEALKADRGVIFVGTRCMVRSTALTRARKLNIEIWQMEPCEPHDEPLFSLVCSAHQK